MAPAHRMMKMPRTIPVCEMAEGIASTPAPTIVFSRLIMLEIHDAVPIIPISLRPRRALSIVSLVLETGFPAEGLLLRK